MNKEQIEAMFKLASTYDSIYNPHKNKSQIKEIYDLVKMESKRNQMIRGRKSEIMYIDEYIYTRLMVAKKDDLIIIKSSLMRKTKADYYISSLYTPLKVNYKNMVLSGKFVSTDNDFKNEEIELNTMYLNINSLSDIFLSSKELIADKACIPVRVVYDNKAGKIIFNNIYPIKDEESLLLDYVNSSNIFAE